MAPIHLRRLSRRHYVSVVVAITPPDSNYRHYACSLLLVVAYHKEDEDMKCLLLTCILSLITLPAISQTPTPAPTPPPITWGCAIRNPTDKVESFVTLDCKEKADESVTFVLDIPKASWFKEWGTIGSREFYYGTGSEGHRFAIRTKATHCDMEYDVSGSRNQDQMCGVMFPKDRAIVVR